MEMLEAINLGYRYLESPVCPRSESTYDVSHEPPKDYTEIRMLGGVVVPSN